VQRPKHGKRQLITVAAVVAGVLGGSWISRWFDHRPPAQAPVLPSLRRRAKAVLELEIITPDGNTWRPSLRAATNATMLDGLDIRQRHLEFKLSATADTTLRVHAYAAALDNLVPFNASVEEDRPTTWRLPMHGGLATIRARLRREYAEG